MNKILKLLLVGMLCIFLTGCSSDSSSSNNSSSNNGTSSDSTNKTETCSNRSSSNVITKSSGNVMISNISDISGISDYAYYEDIKTITFLDDYNALPSNVGDVSYDISENGDGCVMLYIDYSQEDEMYDFYIVG